jgi:hypothetical protein
LENAEARLAESFSLRAVVDRLEDFSARVGQRLTQLDWLGRRELIRMLVARVEIDEEGATVVYRLPNTSLPDNTAAPETGHGGANTPCYQLRGRRSDYVLWKSFENSLRRLVKNSAGLVGVDRVVAP